MIEKIKQKPILFIVIGFLLLLLIGTTTFFLIKSSSKSKNTTSSATPTPVLPPADPSIVVTLEPLDPGKTVLLTISKLPKEIHSLEYELTYKTKENKTEGVFGMIKLESGESEVERELTLGTCSSGVCRYHSLSENKGILTIKFISTKGASRFQKEFNLLSF